MKLNLKIRIIVLGFIFTLSTIIYYNFNLTVGYSDEINLGDKNVKLSQISGKIHIDNNWSDVKTAGICTGEGTKSKPYIIEDLVIDGGGSGRCIWIENSAVYFEIDNCSLYNAGNNGIHLANVDNGLIIDNNASDNGDGGIYAENCDNNKISGNFVNSNTHYGIVLGQESDNNIVSGNILKGNEECIEEEDCEGNKFKNNKYCNYDESEKFIVQKQ